MQNFCSDLYAFSLDLLINNYPYSIHWIHRLSHATQWLFLDRECAEAMKLKLPIYHTHNKKVSLWSIFFSILLLHIHFVDILQFIRFTPACKISTHRMKSSSISINSLQHTLSTDTFGRWIFFTSFFYARQCLVHQSTVCWIFHWLASIREYWVWAFFRNEKLLHVAVKSFALPVYTQNST